MNGHIQCDTSMSTQYMFGKQYNHIKDVVIMLGIVISMFKCNFRQRNTDNLSDEHLLL